MLLAIVALVAGALAAHRTIGEAPADPPLQFANSTATPAAPFPSR